MNKLKSFLVCLLLLPTAVARCEAGTIETTFSFIPEVGESVNSVSLRGSFNGWDEWPMDEQEDGSWSITICLEPGKHLYKYFLDGAWIEDMSNGHNGKPLDADALDYESDGFGGKNAYRTIESDGVSTHKTDDPAYLCVSGGELIIKIKTPPNTNSVSFITGNEKVPMERQLWWDHGAIWRVAVDNSPLDYRFEVDGIDSEDFSYSGEFHFPEVKWVDNGVSYQIFPERFFNGNESNDLLALESDEYNFNDLWMGEKPILSDWNAPITPQHCCHQYFGGDLEGVIEKLDYLEEMDIGLIYLNPIFDSGSAHGYDTHDYELVSPKFGDEENLRFLLDEAHSRDMRIIFDFVPNHTGLGFWAFQDVVEKGRESEYWDWYFIKKYPFKPGDASAYECWWDVPSLPQLNNTNPEVREYLFGVVDRWLDFGFDGLRIDVPNEVVDAHAFFAGLREVVKEEHPESYIVGEIWGTDSSWLQGDQFDSLMNYAMGREILLNYANNTMSSRDAVQKLAAYYAAYGENVHGMGFNVVSTHDTGRLLTDLGGGNFGEVTKTIGIMRLKLLTTLLYTMPGTPVIFQGDERGITGQKELYDSHRYPIEWDSVNKDLSGHYKKLSGMRDSTPAFESSCVSLYETDSEILSFFRGDNRDVLVIANNHYSSHSTDLPPGSWRVYGSSEILRGEVRVPPISAIVLVRE